MNETQLQINTISSVNKSTEAGLINLNATQNCTNAERRHLFGANCGGDVTSSVQSVHQSGRVFRLNEPYINDATPIMPITAVDSIPWINDYQPVDRIQTDEDDDDDDDDDRQGNDDDDYDDRRNKIRVNEIDNRKFQSGRKSTERSRKDWKEGQARKISPPRRGASKREDKFSDATAKTKRFASNDRSFDNMNLVPVKLKNLLSKRIRRMLIQKLKLFNLNSIKSGQKAKRSLPRLKIPFKVQSINESMDVNLENMRQKRRDKAK